MRQRSLAETGFELVTKRTRKREFLDEMEGALSRPDEEYGATHDTVRVEQFVDGAPTVAGGTHGMSASTVRQIAQHTAQSTSELADAAANLPHKNCVTTFQAFPLANSFVSMVYADLP
jgi:hypothetical protein